MPKDEQLLALLAVYHQNDSARLSCAIRQGCAYDCCVGLQGDRKGRPYQTTDRPAKAYHSRGAGFTPSACPSSGWGWALPSTLKLVPMGDPLRSPCWLAATAEAVCKNLTRTPGGIRQQQLDKTFTTP